MQTNKNNNKETKHKRLGGKERERIVKLRKFCSRERETERQRERQRVRERETETENCEVTAILLCQFMSDSRQWRNRLTLH